MDVTEDAVSSDHVALKAQGVNMFSARLRADKTLEQVETESKGAFTAGTLSRWEAGNGEPRARQIAILCRIYDCTAEELLAGAPAFDGGLFCNSAAEAASFLGCGERYMREAIASGEVPSHYFFGRKRVYKRELLNWALSR